MHSFDKNIHLCVKSNKDRGHSHHLSYFCAFYNQCSSHSEKSILIIINIEISFPICGHHIMESYYLESDFFHSAECF